MILKASKRGGARQMARHLMNGEKNEHVTVHEISGFVSNKVDEALEEIYAISRGTRCSRFMFSLSLNPPQNEDVSIKDFDDALERIEEKLGLQNQPRVVVFHEKNGRRHCHCVWSRIDAEKMKAIDQPYFKNKLKDVSKELYLDHGWQLPQGFINRSFKSPLNFTRQEWQQAERTGQNPKTIKAALQECWATSTDKTSFKDALKDRGYFLAKGDRRGFVVVDIHGEVYSLPRQLTVKKKEIEKRIGKTSEQPSVSQVKQQIAGQLSTLFNNFLNEQKKDHKKALSPLLKVKKAMTSQHRTDRAAQKSFQEKRWHNEEQNRVSRIRKGFKGLWDKLTGTYWKLRKQNEKETWQSHARDQKECETVIKKQLVQRQGLQIQLNQLQSKQDKARKNLIRDLSYMADVTIGKDDNIKENDHSVSKTFERISNKDKKRDIGSEPEI